MIDNDETGEVPAIGLEPTVPPTAAQAPPTGPQDGAGAMWRHGRRLIIQKDAILPHRCVKCNAAAADHSMRKTYYWHPPVLYLTLLAGILVYVILALILRKRGTIRFSLCPAHRLRRTMHIALSLLLAIGSPILCIALAVQLDHPWPLLLMLIVIIATGIYAVLCIAPLRPTRIDDDWLTMAGAGEDFLATVPEVPMSPG